VLQGDRSKEDVEKKFLQMAMAVGSVALGAVSIP